MGTAAHTVSLTIKVSERELETIDGLRGPLGRSTWVRSLITRAQRAEEKVAPTSQPPVRSRPSSPALAVVGPEFRKPERHLHRYQRTGDPLRHVKGVAVHRWECECGAHKEE